MTNKKVEFFEIRCKKCDWIELWGLERMLAALVRIGKYRTKTDFDPEIVRELFFFNLDNIVCPDCQLKGVVARKTLKNEYTWDDQVLCEICSKNIPQQRLQALPNAKHCVSCQEKLENGHTEQWHKI